jgi:hypothetical protein
MPWIDCLLLHESFKEGLAILPFNLEACRGAPCLADMAFAIQSVRYFIS